MSHHRLPRAFLLVGLWMFSALLVCLPSAAAGVPERCGKITEDTTIGRAQKGIYVLDCDLTVGPGATLRIERGTTVEVAHGHKLVVDGRLLAEGSSAAPVTFTSSGDAHHAGDWQGIVVQKGGEVELGHTIIRYATIGVRGEPGSSLSVEHSIIAQMSANAVRGFRLAAVTVTHTVVGETGGAAMIIDSPALDPEKLGGNSMDGHDGGMQLSGTFTRSGLLAERHGLVAQIGTDQRDDLRIGPDATVTLPSGAIVKATRGRKLIVDGRLLAEGSKFAPVTFTSSGAEHHAGDWQGIVVQKGGEVDLDHTIVRYATFGVRGEPGSSLSVENCVISHVSANAVRGFKLAAVTVSHNLVGPTGGPAMIVDSPELDPEKLGGNSMDGTAGQMQLSGIFTRSGALTERRGLFVVIGSDQRDDLRVAADTTLALPAGEVLKGNLGRRLIVDGRLLAEGTGRAPVTFTSVRDGRIGGGGDPAMPPGAGDWGGIVAERGSTVDLEMTTLRYAATALTAKKGATVAVHGRILDSTVGVAGTDDPVDATEVFWGDPSGPAPIGKGVPVTGSGVVVQPWIR